MASVSVRNVDKAFGDVSVMRGIDLDIADGEFVVLVGASGCGKSTLLRMIAGLESITAGEIFIGGRRVNDLEPRERDIAMVFQSYALYPHLDVRDNMSFSMKLRGKEATEIATQVGETSGVLNLAHLLDRFPRQLSGGQRQRVAMGRAIVRHPQVFLMDEPLSNLDAKLRVSTRAQIAALQRRLGITTVYVTHDQVEAMTMGDRVAVLKDGLLQQVDTPLNLYDRPGNAFVAGFIGSPAMNLLKVNVTEGGVRLGNTNVNLLPETRSKLGSEQEAIMGVRPESFRVASENDEGLLAVVDVVEELGADAYVYATLSQNGGGEPKVEQLVTPGAEDNLEETSERVELIARVDARKPPSRGSTIRFAVEPERIHLFS